MWSINKVNVVLFPAVVSCVWFWMTYTLTATVWISVLSTFIPVLSHLALLSVSFRVGMNEGYKEGKEDGLHTGALEGMKWADQQWREYIEKRTEELKKTI